jgi:hypothetical protein
MGGSSIRPFEILIHNLSLLASPSTPAIEKSDHFW